MRRLRQMGREAPADPAEWQKAARGADGRRYPWGNDFDRLRCNTNESGIGELTVAGRYPRGVSPYGCFDMVGNVLQWCQDSGEPPSKTRTAGRCAASRSTRRAQRPVAGEWSGGRKPAGAAVPASVARRTSDFS